MRAIKIDSKNRQITEIEISDLEHFHLDGMREVVEGWICQGFIYPHGRHVCYVNDEGLLNSPTHFFSSKYSSQPLAGNGIIVGLGISGKTLMCKLSIEEVVNDIRFYELDEIRTGIRAGLFDFSSYITNLDSGEKQLITRIDLGAFDKD